MAPMANLSATSVSFPIHQVETQTTYQAVTLPKSSSVPIPISSITITGTNSGEFAPSSNCPLSPATLAVNASCAINVTFTPTGLFTRAATLAISDNAIGNPQQVTLAGTGLDPLPSLSATSVNFPNQQV